jgi:hypothetical protein
LIVRQIQQYNAEGMCLGDTIAVWRVSEENSQEIEPEREPSNGMYFQEGDAGFSISPDFKNIIIEWQVGPRYGRGCRYDIVLKNSNIILQNKGDLWVS